MISATNRGNVIKLIDGVWQYEDGIPLKDNERECTRCGRMPNLDGSDACLGHIDGATSACCGHGIDKGYVIKE